MLKKWQHLSHAPVFLRIHDLFFPTWLSVYWPLLLDLTIEPHPYSQASRCPAHPPSSGEILRACLPRRGPSCPLSAGRTLSSSPRPPLPSVCVCVYVGGVPCFLCLWWSTSPCRFPGQDTWEVVFKTVCLKMPDSEFGGCRVPRWRSFLTPGALPRPLGALLRRPRLPGPVLSPALCFPPEVFSFSFLLVPGL